MTQVQQEWENMRLNYQSRYSRMYKRCKVKPDAEYHGAMLEMSYVLINVFGLTSKQVEEVEKNSGLTDADIENELVTNDFDARR